MNDEALDLFHNGKSYNLIYNYIYHKATHPGGGEDWKGAEIDTINPDPEDELQMLIKQIVDAAHDEYRLPRGMPPIPPPDDPIWPRKL